MTELKNLFANAPLVQILDFLLEHDDQDFSRTEISRCIGVSRTTVLRIWPVLEAYGIVTHTRRIERAEMYALNTESRLIQALQHLDLILVMDKQTSPDSQVDESL